MGKNGIGSAVTYVRTHWNTKNPGEYLTLRDIVFFTIGAMGINAFSFVSTFLNFTSGYFAGSVMGVSPQEFYIINIITTIFGYIFIFVNPLNVLIFENHGHIEKKTARFALIFWICQFAAGVALYFVPSHPFETIIKGFPQIIANLCVTAASVNLLNWLVRYKFSAKYGRLKPFFIVYLVPILALIVAIPNIPMNISHTFTLVVLHLLTTLLYNLQLIYINYMGLVPLLSPNSNERQKLISYCALPIGLLSSIYSTLFPIIISATGGYLDIRTYKVFIPIFGTIAILLSLFMLPIKEHVIENTENRVKVKFWKAAKQVLRNKNMWITKVPEMFTTWGIAGEVMNLFFIYSLRQEWLMGIATAATSLITSNIPKLIVPTLIKKFEKRDLIIVTKLLAMVFMCGYFIGIKFQNIWFLFLFNALRNFFEKIFWQVTFGINADVLDHHQWKYGERADSSSTLFSWFTQPISILVGSVVPVVLAKQGFTSNWDVLFDSGIFASVVSIYTIFNLLYFLVTTIPFFFYDITREKHAMCIRELKLRVESEMGAAENSKGNQNETQISESSREADTV